MIHLTNPALFQTRSFINNEWVEADGGQTYPVYNPFDGVVIAELPNLGATETRRAIEAAEQVSNLA